VRASATRSGSAEATRARSPVGSAARSFHTKPEPVSAARAPPASTASSISGSRSARLVFTSIPTGDVTITSVPSGSAASTRAKAASTLW
jgi:hypothetical protein